MFLTGEILSPIPNLSSDRKLGDKKSAEAIVAETVNEN